MAVDQNQFQSASLVHEGAALTVEPKHLADLIRGSSRWLGPKDPSSWLVVDVFDRVRRKNKAVPEGVILELCALAMGLTRDKIVSSIRWHENYMRFHDGDYDYKVLKEEPE